MSSPPPATLSPPPTTGPPISGAGGQRVAAAPLHLVWHTGAHGQVDYVNAAWCAYTGLNLARSRGDGWQQALHPDDRVRWQAAWAQGAGTGQPYGLAYRLQRADGAYGWFLGHVEAIRGVTGHIAGWVGTAIATNDGPSLEQEATTVPPGEPAAPAALSGAHTYLAAATHDLKNQLTVIRGTAQIVERLIRQVGAVEPERVLAGLAQIQRSTTKMRRQLDEVFDLTRVQSALPLQFFPQPADLVALTRGCVAEYAQTTDHALTLSTTLATLVGDWDGPRLDRVVANLLSNAIKYSAPASAISVTIARDGSGRRGVAVLTVQDHGVGIPAQDMPRIFTPFYRGSNVVQRTDGTGIGLYGARAIVEQQGGTLALQSTEGVGTTVTVRLPLTA